jgi:uncharacterized protein (TIGR03067 family)
MKINAAFIKTIINMTLLLSYLMYFNLPGLWASGTANIRNDKKSSALYGRLRDGITDLPIADGYVFVLDSNQEHMQGYSKTRVGRGPDSGYWQVTELPDSGEVWLVAFHPKVKTGLAIKRVSLNGMYQKVPKLDTSIVVSQTLTDQSVLALLGTIAHEANRIMGDKSAIEFVESLLGEIQENMDMNTLSKTENKKNVIKNDSDTCTDSLTDKEELQGTWSLVAFASSDGTYEEIKAGDIQSFILEDKIINFNKIQDDKDVYDYLINPNTKPKTIDMRIESQIMEGIYRLEKDRLIMCFSGSAGKQRPLDFENKAGSEHLLFTYLREQPCSMEIIDDIYSQAMLASAGSNGRLLASSRHGEWATSHAFLGNFLGCPSLDGAYGLTVGRGNELNTYIFEYFAMDQHKGAKRIWRPIGCEIGSTEEVYSRYSIHIQDFEKEESDHELLCTVAHQRYSLLRKWSRSDGILDGHARAKADAIKEYLPEETKEYLASKEYQFIHPNDYDKLHSFASGVKGLAKGVTEGWKAGKGEGVTDR